MFNMKNPGSSVVEDYLSGIETTENLTNEQDTWNEETEETQDGSVFGPVAPSQAKDELPFPDENDEGVNAFVYYTVPQIVRTAFEKDTDEPEYGFHNAESKLKVEGELGPREKQVYRYFRRRLIMDLLNFLLCHLLAVEPDDPIEFLLGILDNCLLFRSGHIEHPPTLFEKHHLEAMFRSFDPSKTGFITYDHYLIAMKTLLVRNFNREPRREGVHNLIAKDEFVKNARSALADSLLDFIVVPQGATSSTEELAKDVTAVRTTREPTEATKAHKYMKQLLRDSRKTGKLFGESIPKAAEEEQSDGPVKSPELFRKFGANVNQLKSLQEAFRPPSD